MKKVFFGLMASALILSASSCNKCGYCQYAGGSKSSATCQSTTTSALGLDPYKQAEADCKTNTGATWVVQ